MNRNSAVTIPATGYTESDVAWWLPYLLQWTAVGLSWPLALLSHTMWGTDPAVLPWITVVLTAAGGGLAVIVHKITARRSSVQVHATATVAAGMAWLIAATITHPATRPTLDAWLIGAPIIALSWNVRRLTRSGGDKTGGTKSSDSDLTKAVKAIKSVKVIEASDTKAVAQIEAAPGHTADEIVRGRGNMAATLEVGAGRVRAMVDPDNHSMATVVVVPEDQLREPKPWPGPTAPGGSIMDPITIGIYEDSLPARFWLPGDPARQRNATHLLLMGMTGSGKTHLAKEIWVEILTRRDCALVLADAAKGLQSIGRAAPYAAWADDTLDGTTGIVDQLMHVVTARTDQLGAEGLEEWTPASSLDYCVIWIEEAARAVRDSDTLVDVAQTARSAGLSLVLSMQRPDMTNIPVTVRQQIGAVICCGVKSLNDATFALGEELIEQGADPSIWKNKRPGYFYLDAPGLDEDRPATPGRSFDRADAEMAEWLRRGADWRPDGLDAVTARAAGKAYANRPRFELDPAGRPVKIKPGGANTAPNSANTDPEDDIEDADMTDTEQDTEHESRAARDPFTARISERDDRNTLPLPEDTEPDLPPVDVDDPLPETADDQELRFPPAKPTPAEARAALAAHIAELRAAGATTVGPRDIGADIYAAIRRSRPWVSGEMSRLAAIGELVETGTPGVYRWPTAANAA